MHPCNSPTQAFVRQGPRSGAWGSRVDRPNQCSSIPPRRTRASRRTTGAWNHVRVRCGPLSGLCRSLGRRRLACPRVRVSACPRVRVSACPQECRCAGVRERSRAGGVRAAQRVMRRRAGVRVDSSRDLPRVAIRQTLEGGDRGLARSGPCPHRIERVRWAVFAPARWRPDRGASSTERLRGCESRSAL